MHVQHPRRPSAFVQIIDILGDDQQVALPFAIEPGERQMPGIRRDRRQRRAPLVVEIEHQRTIAL